MRTFSVASATTLALSLAASALGQVGTGFTITDGDVIFTQGNSPTSGTGTGATGAVLRAAGAASPDHLFQNWWWYRVEGENRETSFFNATGTVAGGNTATTNWTFPSFTASLTYVASDTGTSTGTVTETMVITNTSPAAIRLNLYNYSDFDMNATSGSDSAVLADADTMRINDTVVPTAIADFVGVNRTNYQVTAFSTLRTLLTNTAADNLNNTGLPFSGDFTGAFQWVLDIPGGGTATVVERLSIVPEPASLSLLALAGFAFIRRR